MAIGVALAIAAKSPKPTEVLATDLIAPTLQFKILAGRIAEGDLLEGCKPAPAERAYVEHRDTILVLECKNGVRLELDNVIFDKDHGSILKVEAIR